MLYPSIIDLLKTVDDRYTLVMLVSKRARRLVEGEKPLVKVDSNKPVTVAINEISEGKVHYTRPDVKSFK